MTCRIGMSSKPLERITHWERQCDGHFNSKILVSGLTYDDAQMREFLEAAICGDSCIQEPGGESKPGSVYSVYRVDCN